MIFLVFSDTMGNIMNSTKQTEEKVFSYMKEHHMLKAGDRIVAGISGGADSICLLFVLLQWAKQVPLSLAAVHVHHGIRKEAEEDARYVEELCRQQGIPFFLTRADARAIAAQDKCSEEEAGRNIRYEAFAKAAQEFGADKIAVAHNSNDCSETMLFHLFRGSGLKGLCGISPVRENIIRPLLCLERNEIEEYLQQKNLLWRMDCTNAGDDYTRNRIRHHILPYAEKEIASGCVNHMTRTAQLLAEAEDYLAMQTEAARVRCVVCSETGRNAGRVCENRRKQDEERSQILEISVAAFAEEHPAIQKRLLLSLVKSLTPSMKDISYVHIQALLTLFEREGSRSLDLPFDIRARREYGKVFLQRQMLRSDSGDKGRKMEAIPADSLSPGGESLTIQVGEHTWLEFSLLFCKDLEEFTSDAMKKSENECTKWFDYDKIEKSLVVRTRKTGDYLTIADGKGGQIHKSLKDYMINAKIPKERREEIPVVADGEHILWLVGWRISEYYKINRNTRRILQVQLRGGCEGGKVEENYGRES